MKKTKKTASFLRINLGLQGELIPWIEGKCQESGLKPLHIIRMELMQAMRREQEEKKANG